ncbi:hypothetical protein VTL71DRAFT_2383 [Oculimacula yallundae]|uniref:Uncharacterized protein n=1 Tax=Oculimacula yallundae TaxID=86028 RepID=A0ABR4C9G4_9HELO
MPPPPKPPSPLPPAPPPVLTPFALKYGISPTRAHFNGLLNPAYPTFQKSFYTPIFSVHPNANSIERDRAERTVNLQRFRLKGLTTLSLIQNEIISENRMRIATLTNPIHPLLARWRWATILPGQVMYPLVDGNGVTRGVWDLEQNDLAWDTMLPSIRLASMVLSHLHTHPWLDTLLLGEENLLDPNRFPAYQPPQQDPSTAQHHKVMRIRTPGPQNAAECAAAFADLQRWSALSNLSLGMVSCDKGPLGLPNADKRVVNGFASWLRPLDVNFPSRCSMYIAYERAALLLKHGLSDSDRLCMQLLIANTIVHETMHSIGNAKRHREQSRIVGGDDYPFLREPYLEDEVVAELGCSMDDAVWGGILCGVSDTIEDDNFVPLGYGVLKGPQPILSLAPTLISPPLSKLDVFRPIQVTYYEMIQQADFWDFRVRNFSHFRPGLIVVNGGSSDLLSIKDRNGPRTLWEVVVNQPDYNQALLPPNRATYLINKILVMTTADRVAYVKAQKERRAYRVYESVLKERIRQTEQVWDRCEMLTRGDMTRGDFNSVQGIGSLLNAIDEILGTESRLLLALSAFDNSSDAYDRGVKDARSFNRGLRSFLNDICIVSTVPMVPDLVARARKLFLIIEDTRVLLTVRPDLPNGISLADDMILAKVDEADCVQKIEEARILLEAGNHHAANKMCEEVSRSMSSTLLTKCAARILMCYSDQNVYIVRLNVLSRAIETLQQTLAPVGREFEQARVLGRAQQLQDRLVVRDMAQRRPDLATVFIP